MILDDDAVRDLFEMAVRPLRAELLRELRADAVRSSTSPVSALPRAAEMVTDDIEQQCRHRRTFASSLVAVAACAALVVGLAVLLRDRDRTPAVNDGGAVPAVPVAFGDFVWPAPPRDFVGVNDLVTAFADEVLQWPAFDLEGDFTDERQPQFVTLRNGDRGGAVSGLAAPSPRGWGFVEIGEGNASLTVNEQGGVTLQYSLGGTVETAAVAVRLTDGTERVVEGGIAQVVLPDISAETVLSVLITGADADGTIVAAAGGQFSAIDGAPPTLPRTAPTGRPSGAISDPRNMDFSPWLEGALPWPPEQPNEYLVFDVAALEGWTQLDSIGGHPIGSGDDYAWSSNVSDPSGREFQVAVTSVSEDRAPIPNGRRVDINGVDGLAGEGQVSWPLDDTHTARAAEFGTIEVERALALARQLTTVVVPSISIQLPVDMTPDPAAQFAGVVDGMAWSTSVAPDGMTTIVEGITREFRGGGYFPEYGVEVSQWGNNDHCVFVGAYMPAGTYRPRLVLSDETTIDLPVVSVDAASDAFVACIPYALDARRIDLVDQSGAVAGRAELAAPFLRPSSGMTTTQAVLDGAG